VQIHFSESTIITLLRDSLSVNFGDVGAGEVGGTFSSQSLHDTITCESRPVPELLILRAVKYLSPHTRTLIIRVSREHYRTLWAALTLLRRLGGHQVIARVLHVGGELSEPCPRCAPPW
jgi:ribonuclease P/MRP protein subunit POP5